MSYPTPDDEEQGLEIDSDSTVREIKQRIGVGKDEELRESEKRRRYLQKLARLVTPARPAVRMTTLIPTAAVNQGGEQEDMPERFKVDDPDEPVILMTTREFEQSVTDYPRRVYDAMLQKALLIHEVGHVLYTDSESHEQFRNRVEEGREQMYHKVWNALEDGAIETQLRREYSVAHELDVLNANMMSEDEIGHRIDEETLRFSFFQAITLALLDMGCYPSGLFAKLMDEDNDDLTFAGGEHDRELMEDLIPDMEQTVKAVTTEPSSPKRNEHIWDFWTVVRDYLDEASVSGEKESGLESLLDGDGNIGGGGGGGDSSEDEEDGQGASPVFGKPDDSGSNFGGDVKEAYELSEEVVEQAVEEGISAAMSNEDGDEEVGVSEDDVQVRSPDEDGMDEETEEQYQQELASEAAELDGGQQIMDEAEEYLDIIKDAAEEAADQQRSKGGLQGSPEWRGLTMSIPNYDSYDSDRYRAAEQRANRLAKILRNQLQHERRDQVQKNQRRGRLSTGGGSMMRVNRDDYRIFEQTEEGKEKDYHAMFVLDRSGSMSGQPVRDGEEALGSMALALQKVNRKDKIDVSVMDLYGSQARLTLPFGVDADTMRGNLFNGHTSGGTPLAKVLHLARQRVLEEDTHPFMVVVTDGRPSNRDAFRAEVKKANFPVLGVYITSKGASRSGNHSGDESAFDRMVYVTDTDEIDDALMDLCQQVMF